MYVYLTLEEGFNYAVDKDHLLWSEELVYGNWEDGLSGDGTRQKTVDVLVPESVQRNGTWYLHVFMAKMGYTLDSESKDYKEQAITYQSTCENHECEADNRNIDFVSFVSFQCLINTVSAECTTLPIC